MSRSPSPEPESANAAMARAFSRRLLRACDTSPREELRTYGRQAIIARALGKSEEAVRKYFNGIMVPRRDTMKKLARFLGVDETWLAMGVQSGVTPEQTRVLVRTARGGVLYVRGLIQLDGYETADSSGKGPEDFMAIIQGRSFAVRVSVAVEEDDGTFLVAVPAEYENLCVLAVVPRRGGYTVLHLPPKLIDRHKRRHEGDFAVRVERAGTGYVSKTDPWPKISDMGALAA